MSKYDRGQYQQVRTKPWKVHPIWRGIGCFFIILIPIMSCVGGRYFQELNMQNNWVTTPDMYKSINPTNEVSRFLTSLSTRSKELNFLNGVVAGLPQTGDIFYLEIGVAVLLLIVGFGLLSLVYSAMYRAVGPSRYGPTDSPPVKRSPARRPR